AGFQVYRRLRSAITLAAQRESHLVPDRIFKNPIAVQSGFSGAELFPLCTASRVGLSPVGIHPRRARRPQILAHEKNSFTPTCNSLLLLVGARKIKRRRDFARLRVARPRNRRRQDQPRRFSVTD